MVKEFQFGLPEKEKKIPRLLNAKFIYTNPKIKVNKWNHYQEVLPFDYDLTFPKSVVAAKYRSFGDGTTVPDFSTTTRDMTEQILDKAKKYKIVLPKPKIDYYTYSKKIDDELKFEKVAKIEAADYLTVMKTDFIAPKNIIYHGVSFKPENPSLYRLKYIMGDADCEHKFTDDGMITTMIKTQKLKRKLFRSFNPATGKYTDEED